MTQNKDKFFKGEIDKETQKLIARIQRRANGQKNALVEKLKKLITDEEQLKLTMGMVNMLIYQTERRVRAETYILSNQQSREKIREAIQALDNSLAQQKKMMLDITCDISDEDSEVF